MPVRAYRLTLVALLSTAVVLVVCWLARTVQHGTLSVSLDRTQIEEALSPSFPIHKDAVLAAVTLSSPQVSLTDGADRIGLGVDASVSVLGRPALSGSLQIDGAVRYDAPSGAFFLTDPRVLDLHVQHIPADVEGALTALASDAVRHNVAQIPLYRLQRRNEAEALARYVLRSARVEHGRLVLVLGLPTAR